MPKPRNSKVESASQRSKLEARRAPYWTRLAPGIALGYRRNEGAGSWVVRSNNGNGAEWTKRIGIADDLEPAAPPLVLTFYQAQEVARQLARGHGQDAPVDDGRPETVDEALTNYASDLKARGANVYNARAPRHHLTKVLLDKPVQLLSSKELEAWRNSLIDKVEPATINRMLKSLRTALKQAAQRDPRIKPQWKIGLKDLPDALNDRNVILTDDEVRALIAGAYAHDPALGLLADVLAVTGARPSQAARLVVADLIISDPLRPRLMMPRSAKGGGVNRIERKSQRVPVPITPVLAQRLKAAAAGRAPNAPLLLRGGGFSWGKRPHRYYSDDISTVVKAIGLDAEVVTIYALRHSSIARQLLRSVPIRVVAGTHDTSVPIIERHYSRYITDHSDDLSRAALLH
jgi:integrase